MIVKCLLFIGVFFICSIRASHYPLPSSESRLLGENIYHQVQKGDYFQKIAEQYNVGFMALMAANKELDPFLPKAGSRVLVPKQLILPYGLREGIVINLAELRLYYFSPDNNTVSVFPVGIGKQGFSTPLSTSFISEKHKDPEWRPSQEMRARYLQEHNKAMPKVYPPGPDNPFGKYAMRLGSSEYLIHGTNQRLGIGMRSSSGCIRLFDDDIEWLFQHVALNTKVRIINQPVKMSYENNLGRFIEVHQPLSDMNGDNVEIEITEAMKIFFGQSTPRLKQLNEIISLQQGVVTQLVN